jgi:hypothetical protein
LSDHGPSAADLGTALASDKAVCMVRSARQQSSDATFHAREKNFMSKGRDEQKGAPKKDSRDEPRHHGGQGGEREHRDDRRESGISHEDREERTQRTEPRR